MPISAPGSRNSRCLPVSRRRTMNAALHAHDGEYPGKRGERQVVQHADRQLERQRGDEMHRPDADAHREAAAHHPELPVGGVRIAHARGEEQRDVRRGHRHEVRQEHQPEVEILRHIPHLAAPRGARTVAYCTARTTTYVMAERLWYSLAPHEPIQTIQAGAQGRRSPSSTTTASSAICWICTCARRATRCSPPRTRWRPGA